MAVKVQEEAQEGSDRSSCHCSWTSGNTSEVLPLTEHSVSTWKGPSSTVKLSGAEHLRLNYIIFATVHAWRIAAVHWYLLTFYLSAIIRDLVSPQLHSASLALHKEGGPLKDFLKKDIPTHKSLTKIFSLLSRKNEILLNSKFDWVCKPKNEQSPLTVSQEQTKFINFFPITINKEQQLWSSILPLTESQDHLVIWCPCLPKVRLNPQPDPIIIESENGLEEMVHNTSRDGEYTVSVYFWRL